MDLYTASKYDLQQKLHSYDREEAARYDYERQHQSSCPMDRFAIVRMTLKNNDGPDEEIESRQPCCAECYGKYYKIEFPGSELEQAEVITLHPNQAA